MFLAHFVGGGIDPVLDMIVDDFYEYLDYALDLYQNEAKMPRRTILSGIEK